LHGRMGRAGAGDNRLQVLLPAVPPPVTPPVNLEQQRRRDASATAANFEIRR
jgi:hypothetical protein